MICSWLRALRVIPLLVALCAAVPVTSAKTSSVPWRIEHLAHQLRALSPTVTASDASLLALHAHDASADLARSYRPVGPPQFHNFLVNAGVKKRGLCHHWARDLGARLAALQLRTLTLRWGIARGGTLREHNAVVVTARGQRFEEGIVLDAWRHSGRLFFTDVAADRYPWREDRHESFVPREIHRHASARR